MPINIEQAFINTVIAFKLMAFSYSLKSFFKDEYKKNDNEYVIPFAHILYFKRHVFQLIRQSCDYVCPYEKECDGHKLLKFIEKLYQFQHHAVIEKKCYFGKFRFYNFKLKRDEVHGCEKVNGWDFDYYEAKDLSHLSFSQRCRYLD